VERLICRKPKGRVITPEGVAKINKKPVGGTQWGDAKKKGWGSIRHAGVVSEKLGGEGTVPVSTGEKIKGGEPFANAKGGRDPGHHTSTRTFIFEKCKE